MLHSVCARYVHEWLSAMLSAGSVQEWTCHVEEMADRLAQEALQQLQLRADQPQHAPPRRSTLPPGLFDPSLLPNHPLPSQPPSRAREAAKLAAAIASSPPPPPRAPSVASDSASLLSAVDAILAEAEAVLTREQYVDESEQKQSRQAERRRQQVERNTAIAQANGMKHRQQRLLAMQPNRHISPTIPHAGASSPPTHIPLSVAVGPQAMRSTEIVRMKKESEGRTEQRRRERDEAVKAAMLDRQRRDIIARYEEAEGKRRDEERKEQEEQLHKTQQEGRKQEQQERAQREEESSRQHIKQQLEDKKRQAADAIRQQRALAKQQQQQQLVAHCTQTLQRRTDKRVLQQAWQQWLAAVIETSRQKSAKAVSVWRYSCTVRYFRLWRRGSRQAKEERMRVEEEKLKRRKEERRVQAEAHWKLKSAQRSVPSHAAVSS